METFITVILIVVAVFQIILFFKLWKATNDISKMKKESQILNRNVDMMIDNQQRLNALIGDNVMDLKTKVIRLHFQGQDDKALEMIREAILPYLYELHYKQMRKSKTKNSYNFCHTQYNEDAEQHIKKYTYLYNLIGKDMPEEFKNVDVSDSSLFSETVWKHGKN